MSDRRIETDVRALAITSLSSKKQIDLPASYHFTGKIVALLL